MDEIDRNTDALNSVNQEFFSFLFNFHILGNYTENNLLKYCGEEIASIVKHFELRDPFEICFALIYLLDSGSDLPWLYLPASVLVERAGQMLPWYGDDYDEVEDNHWAEYYNREEYYPRAINPNKVPDLPDQYSLDYSCDGYADHDEVRANLAQIIYRTTGGLLPRDIHRYDDAIKEIGRASCRERV